MLRWEFVLLCWEGLCVVVLCGMVWYGMVWYGMVYGVLHGMRYRLEDDAIQARPEEPSNSAQHFPSPSPTITITITITIHPTNLTKPPIKPPLPSQNPSMHLTLLPTAKTPTVNLPTRHARFVSFRAANPQQQKIHLPLPPLNPNYPTPHRSSKQQLALVLPHPFFFESIPWSIVEPAYLTR
ncbi:hypothetical protein IAQ61_007313 [Plenodomus lingam]|uniref:uncharacterized protein n=1 Tax=Leptosphaeria maculans TaxID=5022 RepID=UPI00332EB31C|nr:hypothetical protein IAQ61_007313 [Plenodomus lingam]